MADDSGRTGISDGPAHIPAGIPRWVKIFLIVAAAALVLLILAMMISGSQHGPGRHLSSVAPTAMTNLHPMAETPIETFGKANS